MVADHFTKPLQGNAFCKFWALIMNIDPNNPDHDMYWDRLINPSPQECVVYNENQKHVRFSKGTEPDSGVYKTQKNKIKDQKTRFNGGLKMIHGA